MNYDVRVTTPPDVTSRSATKPRSSYSYANDNSSVEHPAGC